MYWFLGIGLGIAVPAVLVCAALAAIAWKAYKVVVHPAHGFFDAPRMGDALEREEIRFLSRDGTQLAAWFIAGSRRQTVLLLHGYTACKDDMLSHAAFLHDAGFSLLLLDLRYCGDSAGVACTLGANERDDVQAAIEYLQLRDDVDHDGIGILGLSLGASLAILAACDSPSVRAVVAESAFRSLKSAVQQNFRRLHKHAELSGRKSDDQAHRMAPQGQRPARCSRTRGWRITTVRTPADPRSR